MNKIVRTLVIIMFVAGLCLIIYPVFLKLCFNHSADEAIQDYDASKSQHEDLREAMIEYNRKLYLDGQSGLIDQLSYEKPDFLLSDFGIDTEMLAYIEIPAIDVKLPVYNGASGENMARGAAYLANTSLPVGGDNTNCVIAGHTIWKGIYIFKRITELSPGDEILITNFWETMVYRVSETKIIDPGESENIYIKEGRDIITLTTCHPYPENYQRYLVIADHYRGLRK